MQVIDDLERSSQEGVYSEKDIIQTRGIFSSAPLSVEVNRSRRGDM